MDYVSTLVPAMTIGVDLGDEVSEIFFCEGSGEGRQGPRIRTNRERFQKWFSEIPPARVVIECGTHSPWVSRLLAGLGHEVIVANPRAMPRRARKTDLLDAEALAREGRADPTKLFPIQHRGEEAQRDLALLRARNVVVEARTKLTNHARSVVKSFGERLPRCSGPAFVKSTKAAVPAVLKTALDPIYKLIREFDKQIAKYDRNVEELSKKYPETARPRQINGVGPLTSTAFVLVVEEPARFPVTRDVGAYVGLVPKERASGGSKPQLRITKSGDNLLRKLLTNSAQYILGPFGPDCDLRRFGMAIMVRGGKNAKKRAVSAVARKLSVLMLTLWKTNAPYERLYDAKKSKPGAEPPPLGRGKMATRKAAS